MKEFKYDNSNFKKAMAVGVIGIVVVAIIGYLIAIAVMRILS